PNDGGFREDTRSYGHKRNDRQWSQFPAIIRRISSPQRASKFSRNRLEVIELIGVPGGMRTLVCAVKGLPRFVSNRIQRDGWQSWELKKTLWNCYRTLNEPSIG